MERERKKLCELKCILGEEWGTWEFISPSIDVVCVLFPVKFYIICPSNDSLFSVHLLLHFLDFFKRCLIVIDQHICVYSYSSVRPFFAFCVCAEGRREAEPIHGDRQRLVYSFLPSFYDFQGRSIQANKSSYHMLPVPQHKVMSSSNVKIENASIKEEEGNITVAKRNLRFHRVSIVEKN